MAHRGPDAQGRYTDGSVTLGHRRLSIIDVTDSSNQPLTDPTGRYVIVYNGETYNFREIRDALPEHSFRTGSDTEVVLAAYARWGTDCVHKLKGMFAFAIWDREERSLFLCRDRLGVKPLYFFQGDGFFLFASEIRSLMESGLVPRKMDRAAVRGYLSFQSFGYPTSPIEGLSQLEAGSWLLIKGAQFRSEVYWRIGQAEVGGDLEDPLFVRRRIRELLLGSVRSRLVSDVPIGAFLSGGIDSSTVVALMAEAGCRKPATFNVSFEEKDFDESRYAGVIAKKFDTSHTSIRLTPNDFLGDLEEALDAMDSPSGDGLNTFMVSKAVRRSGITVALSGVGGDELFAGYPFFRTQMRLNRLKGLFGMTYGVRNIAASLMKGSSSGKSQRMGAILGAVSTDIAHTYPEYRRIFTPRQIEAFTRLPATHAGGLESQLADKQSAFDRLPEYSQVSAAEFIGYTQQTLLKDTDQMSMAVSLEVREPFFDHELVDFVLQVPDRLKHPKYPKSLLVESMKPLLPDEIVHRRKQGFVLPWVHWMRGPLKDFCDKRIGALAERDFIRGEALTGYWRRFLSGDDSVRWQEIWQFVVLEHWMCRNRVT